MGSSRASHPRRGCTTWPTLGYDFKSTDNNLQFGGTQVFRTPVEIGEFSLGYSAALKDKWGATSFALTGFWSPGGIGGHNNDADFAAARSGSTADYFYATTGRPSIRAPLLAAVVLTVVAFSMLKYPRLAPFAVCVTRL